MSNERPMFVMSMFANKETLLQAKVDWLEDRVKALEEAVAPLNCLEPLWCGRQDHLCLSCELKDE